MAQSQLQSPEVLDERAIERNMTVNASPERIDDAFYSRPDVQVDLAESVIDEATRIAREAAETSTYHVPETPEAITPEVLPQYPDAETARLEVERSTDAVTRIRRETLGLAA